MLPSCIKLEDVPKACLIVLDTLSEISRIVSPKHHFLSDCISCGRNLKKKKSILVIIVKM